MRKKENRQRIIAQRFGFICFCNLCRDGDDDKDNENQSKIEELIDETKEINFARKERDHKEWLRGIYYPKHGGHNPRCGSKDFVVTYCSRVNSTPACGVLMIFEND